MKFSYNLAKALRLRLKNMFLILIGTLALAFGTAAFLVPFELIAGGISGIAIITEQLFGSGFLSVEAMIALLSWLSFFAGLFFLGKSFALKTFLSSALYPLFVSIFIERGLTDFSLGFFDFGAGTLLASVIGGAFVGLGCALSFLGGGSTGGVDVFALVLCKKYPKLRIPHVMLLTDSAIIMLGAFAVADPRKTLLGIFSALTAAFAIEVTLNLKIRIFRTNWHDKKIDNFKK